MLRVGRKTFVNGSVILCNGYEVFLNCSCWSVRKNGNYVDTGGLYTLEDLLKWCMEN